MNPDNLIYHFLVAVFPLIISGIIHMLVVKYDKLSMFKIPFSTKLFGENKTWRGAFIMILINAVILWGVSIIFDLYVVGSFLLGAWLGFAYVLFEIPNSFVKRKLGIPPGGSSSKNKSLFQLIDKIDSSLGVALVYYWLGRADNQEAIFVFIAGTIVHMLFSLLLVQAGIKKDY